VINEPRGREGHSPRWAAEPERKKNKIIIILIKEGEVDQAYAMHSIKTKSIHFVAQKYLIK
jgi:hypothetical protein